MPAIDFILSFFNVKPIAWNKHLNEYIESLGRVYCHTATHSVYLVQWASHVMHKYQNNNNGNNKTSDETLYSAHTDYISLKLLIKWWTKWSNAACCSALHSLFVYTWKIPTKGAWEMCNVGKVICAPFLLFLFHCLSVSHRLQWCAIHQYLIFERETVWRHKHWRELNHSMIATKFRANGIKSSPGDSTPLIWHKNVPIFTFHCRLSLRRGNILIGSQFGSRFVCGFFCAESDSSIAQKRRFSIGCG